MGDTKSIIGTLQRVLKHGKMSVMLKKAVSESIKALKAGDINLAYQITACKSYIVGYMRKMRGHDDEFRESVRLNNKILGGSIYSILDGVHFRLAMMVGDIPSGMSVFEATRDGRVTIQEMRHKGTHPVVERIKFEEVESERRATVRLGTLRG